MIKIGELIVTLQSRSLMTEELDIGQENG